MGCASIKKMSLFNIFFIEHSVLVIQYASNSKGSNGMGGTFDLPPQVTINICIGYSMPLRAVLVEQVAKGARHSFRTLASFGGQSLKYFVEIILQTPPNLRNLRK